MQVRAGDEAAEVWRTAVNVVRWMGGGTNTPDHWKRWQVQLPHVLAALGSAPSDDVESLTWFVEAGWAAYGFCLASNRRDQAGELLRLMMKRSAALPESLLLVGAIRGQYYEDIGDVDECRKLYEGYRDERGPQAGETLQLRFRWARALASTGRFPAAEEQLRAILDELRSPQHVGSGLLVHANLVQVLASQGKDEGAAAESQALLSVVEANPAELDITVLHQVGHALTEGHRTEPAENVFGALLARLDEADEQLSPLYHDISLELLGLLLHSGRERAAIVLIGRLLDLYVPAGGSSPSSPGHLADLVQTRVSLQLELMQSAEAEDELRALLRHQLEAGRDTDSLTIELRIALVRVFIAQELFAHARTELERAEKASAEGGTAPLWTVRLWNARWLCAQDRCAEAVEYYEQAVALLTHDPAGRASVLQEAAACRAAVSGDEAP